MYWQLFISFLQIGMFSIGGGYAAMPLIQSQVVEKYHWLTMSEFTDLITIAEMTPGPIAVNSATFVGTRIAGFAGSMIAVAGCVLPSFIIISILSYVYFKYKKLSLLQSVLGTLRPAVVALIAGAGITIARLVLWNGSPISLDGINWLGAALMISAFVLIRKIKWDPVLVMFLCGGVSLIAMLITGAV